MTMGGMVQGGILLPRLSRPEGPPGSDVLHHRIHYRLGVPYPVRPDVPRVNAGRSPRSRAAGTFGQTFYHYLFSYLGENAAASTFHDK